jgi:GntR family transcriptional regulator
VFHRVNAPLAVVADIPALEADPFRTGGDLYGVLTTAGHPLEWTETVRARMPSPDDSTALRIPTGTPLLSIRRVTRERGTGRVLAIAETRISADDAQLAYTLTPHGTSGGQKLSLRCESTTLALS